MAKNLKIFPSAPLNFGEPLLDLELFCVLRFVLFLLMIVMTSEMEPGHPNTKFYWMSHLMALPSQILCSSYKIALAGYLYRKKYIVVV